MVIFYHSCIWSYIYRYIIKKYACYKKEFIVNNYLVPISSLNVVLSCVIKLSTVQRQCCKLGKSIWKNCGSSNSSMPSFFHDFLVYWYSDREARSLKKNGIKKLHRTSRFYHEVNMEYICTNSKSKSTWSKHGMMVYYF